MAEKLLFMDIWLIKFIRSLPYFSVKAAFSVSGSETQFVKFMKLNFVKGSSGKLILLGHYICSGKKEIKNILPNTQHLLTGIIDCLLDAWRTLFKTPSDNGVNVNVVVCIV